MPTTINDELLRIEGAKADIATAIGGKGVTVPANAKIDDFADLIDAIQTGGGDSNVLRSLIERSITSIEIPNGTTSVGERLFFNSNLLETAILPNSLQTINNYAFSGTALQSITIPDSVTYVGVQSFSLCPNLASVVIGSGVTILRTQIFLQCTSLQEITIPSTVGTINSGCFTGTGLNKIVLLGNNTSLSNANAFDNTPIKSGTGKIYVPNGYGNTYKGASNWSAFANQIYELDSNGNIPT